MGINLKKSNKAPKDITAVKVKKNHTVIIKGFKALTQKEVEDNRSTAYSYIL